MFTVILNLSIKSKLEAKGEIYLMLASRWSAEAGFVYIGVLVGPTGLWGVKLPDIIVKSLLIYIYLSNFKFDIYWLLQVKVLTNQHNYKFSLTTRHNCQISGDIHLSNYKFYI